MKNIEDFFGMKTGSLMESLLSFGTKLVVALAILIIGFWFAKVVSKTVVKVMKGKNSDESLTTFLASLIKATLKILVLITAVTQIGIEVTSFIALLGAAGLAIGMAFSGTLSNFAGGVMILIFRPFNIGDYVQIQGEEGLVKEILIFNTILTTLDNKIIVLANGPVANGTVVNFTKAVNRRVDWSFGIAYGDDLKKAKEVIAQFIADDKRILKDPESFIGLGELGDSSVNITVRAWVKTADYWGVFFDMNERVYNEFGDAGLSIPFPQMDVHIQKEV